MKIVCDIDGVVCTNTWGSYKEAEPLWDNIEILNLLFNQGHQMVFFTARGYETGIDWSIVTENQFKEWGVKYHDIIMGKPSGDVYIDDKAFNVNEGLNQLLEK